MSTPTPILLPENLRGELEDYEYPAEAVVASLEHLPKVAAPVA